MPGHSGIYGNEMTDVLAKSEADSPSAGPLPILPVPPSYFRFRAESRLEKSILEGWTFSSGCEPLHFAQHFMMKVVCISKANHDKMETAQKMKH